MISRGDVMGGALLLQLPGAGFSSDCYQPLGIISAAHQVGSSLWVTHNFAFGRRYLCDVQYAGVGVEYIADVSLALCCCLVSVRQSIGRTSKKLGIVDRTVSTITHKIDGTINHIFHRFPIPVINVQQPERISTNKEVPHRLCSPSF